MRNNWEMVANFWTLNLLKKDEIKNLPISHHEIVYWVWLGRGKLGKSTAAKDAIFLGVRCG